MTSKLEVFMHYPNDSPLDQFYQKNFLEYPEYQYQGIDKGGGFAVAPADE
jgi:hypothetical protein